MSIPGLQGRVAVLLGGESAEREVSLQSGATVLAALREQGVAAFEVDTAVDGWRGQLQEASLAFIALHGPGGEDGTLQGALQVMGLPYTGSGVLGSALALDKQRCKQLWQGAGVATPGFVTLSEDSDWQALMERFGRVFVKPACEGSSIGMALAEDAEALRLAYEVASGYAGEVLAEQYVDGPEYTVAVLGRETLPGIRLETDNTFYDYEAKYLSHETRYHCPCGLSADEEAELAALALRAFDTAGCTVWGRVDVMRNAAGAFQVLEVNTVPGMTSHSLVPMAAAAAGMDVPALVRRIVQLSLEEER